MRMRLEIDGTVSPAVLSSIQITKSLSGRLSQAQFNLSVDGSNPVLPVQQSEVIIYNDVAHDDTDTKIFRGFVVSIESDQKSFSFQTWIVQCNGLETLLDNAIINATYTSQTDRQIIQAAFSSALSSISTSSSTVAELTSAINFSAKDLTFTQFMKNICQVSGGEWRITEDMELSYRAAGSVVAPFGFSNHPTN